MAGEKRFGHSPSRHVKDVGRRAIGLAARPLAVLTVATASAWAQPTEGSGAAPAARMAIFGRWAEPRTILEFREESNGQLSGRVVALMEPVYLPEDDFGPVGAPRRDDNNPDEALRSRPMLGLNLLSDYHFDGKHWQGNIYDPEGGGTYTSWLWVDASGDLHLRGYLGIPLLGRTAVFKPVSLCADHIVQMLQKAGLDDCAGDARDRLPPGHRQKPQSRYSVPRK